MLFTAQTTYIITLLPGTPTVYAQYAQHLSWTSGNIGCASSSPLPGRRLVVDDGVLRGPTMILTES